MMFDYPDRLRARLARALQNANPQGAANTLDEAFATLSADAALSEVVLPCIEEKTHAQESVWTGRPMDQASGMLETCLLALASGWDDGGNPTVVIAATDEDRHALGAIAFGLALRERGWRVVYLGSNTRPESAVVAAEEADALAVVVAVAEPLRIGIVNRNPLARLDPQPAPLARR